MVDDPANYRWSSCPAKVGRTTQAWLDLDPFYLGMGHSEAERAENYATWLKETVPEQELQRIREAVQRGQLMASGTFAQELSEKLGRRLEPRGPGRPRKKIQEQGK